MCNVPRQDSVDVLRDMEMKDTRRSEIRQTVTHLEEEKIGKDIWNDTPSMKDGKQKWFL